MLKSAVRRHDTFLYFAYGGNLLTFYIHTHSPTAEFVSIARLDNYRLDFLKYSHFWGGPTATLVPTANAHVWGVIWRLHVDDKINLDRQKGVEIKKYYVKYVQVHTPYIGAYTCRTHVQKVNPPPRGDGDAVPLERRPSRAYRALTVAGAAEHGLPAHYIRDLKKIKHNGEEGCLRTACLLTRYRESEPCECRVPGRIPREPLKLDLKKKREGNSVKKNQTY